MWFSQQSTTDIIYKGAQWLSGRVPDSRPRGRGFESHRCHCVVSLSKDINPSLVLVQPRKTPPFITERLLMGRKEPNQTNKQKKRALYIYQPDHPSYICTGRTLQLACTKHAIVTICLLGPYADNIWTLIRPDNMSGLIWPWVQTI